MKLLICSLMVFALIGCNSTTYECVEVYGEVGIIQDGCLVEPTANVRIQFLAKERYQMIDGKVISINPQSTRSDSLGRWILSVRPGEYLVHFEKISSNWNDFEHYASVEISVPNQPKWEFTID